MGSVVDPTYYKASSDDFTAVADAIRYAGGTNAVLSFPFGMADAAAALKPNLQSKTATPSTVAQTITPDGAYSETVEIAAVSGSQTSHNSTLNIAVDLSALVSGETYHVEGRVGCGTSSYQSYPVDTDVTYQSGVKLPVQNSGSGMLVGVYLYSNKVSVSLSSGGDVMADCSLTFTKTVEYPAHTGLSQVTVNAIPPEYVVPKLQSKTVTPTDAEQTIVADEIEETLVINTSWSDDGQPAQSGVGYYYELHLTNSLLTVGRRYRLAGKLTLQDGSVTYTQCTLGNTFVLEQDGNSFSFSDKDQPNRYWTVTVYASSILVTCPYNYSFGARIYIYDSPEPYTGLSSVTVEAIPAGGGGGSSVEDMLIMRTLGGEYENSTATYIADYAFYGYSSSTSTPLTCVTFQNANKIGKNAFAYCTHLTNVSFPVASEIDAYCFSFCYQLSSVDLPSVELIGEGAFMSCSMLKEANFPNASFIGSGAFSGCRVLEEVSFPKITSINSSTFLSCQALKRINCQSVISIGNNAFQSCFAISSVSFPVATTIGTGAFSTCSALRSVYFPMVTSIGTSAFYKCGKITALSFPNAEVIMSKAFVNATSLSTIYCPNVTSVGQFAFNICTSLSSAILPHAISIATAAFAGCTRLSVVSLSDITRFESSVFMSCYNLLSLYMTGTSVCSLYYSDIFKNTPIAGVTTSTSGVYGSIFVRASLYDSYISASNWSYYSSRFVSMTDEEIAALTL